MGRTLDLRLIEARQGDDFAEPQILLALSERFQDAHNLAGRLNKKRRASHEQFRALAGLTPRLARIGIALRYVILKIDTDLMSRL
jgi:hypothetical protein